MRAPLALATERKKSSDMVFSIKNYLTAKGKY